MRILLCCAGGFPTNMPMRNMRKVVKGSAKLNEEDSKFIAIPADFLEEEIDNWDVVLVGPQVSHKVDFIEAVCKPKDVPFVVIDKNVYRQIDGATVLKPVLVTRKEHEMGKQSLTWNYKRLCFICGQSCIV